MPCFSHSASLASAEVREKSMSKVHRVNARLNPNDRASLDGLEGVFTEEYLERADKAMDRGEPGLVEDQGNAKPGQNSQLDDFYDAGQERLSSDEVFDFSPDFETAIEQSFERTFFQEAVEAAGCSSADVNFEPETSIGSQEALGQSADEAMVLQSVPDRQADSAPEDEVQVKVDAAAAEADLESRPAGKTSKSQKKRTGLLKNIIEKSTSRLRKSKSTEVTLVDDLFQDSDMVAWSQLITILEGFIELLKRGGEPSEVMSRGLAPAIE